MFKPQQRREQYFKEALANGFTVVEAYEVRKVYIGKEPSKGD